jgi:hypothetical protein
MDLDKALSNVRELAPETKLVFNAELSEIY